MPEHNKVLEFTYRTSKIASYKYKQQNYILGVAIYIRCYFYEFAASLYY